MPPSLDYDRPRPRRDRPDRTVLWVVVGVLGALAALFVVGGLAVILWLVLPARRGKPALPGLPPVPAAAVPAGWQEVSSAEGRFRALMPGRPRVEHRNMPSPFGPVADTAYILDTDRLSIGVVFADFTGPRQGNVSLDAVVNAGRDAIRDKLGGPVRERAFHAGNVPVREALIDSPRQGTCHFRWYLRGRRLYTVSIMGLRGSPPDDVVRRFFDSFQLTD